MSGLTVASTERRWQVGLALGNLFPAVVLGGGCYLLPLRWWAMDVSVGAVVALLVVTSGLALAKPPLALRSLRVAGIALLALGAALLAAFALCLAFVSGIHGAFGNLGAVLMTLVILLIAPYALVYPVCELLVVHRLRRAHAPASTAPESVSPLTAQAEEA